MVVRWEVRVVREVERDKRAVDKFVAEGFVDRRIDVVEWIVRSESPWVEREVRREVTRLSSRFGFVVVSCDFWDCHRKDQS